MKFYRRPSTSIILKGRVVHATESAVKWLVEGTEREIWFPQAMVKIEGDTIRVPKKLYRYSQKRV